MRSRFAVVSLQYMATDFLPFIYTYGAAACVRHTDLQWKQRLAEHIRILLSLDLTQTDLNLRLSPLDLNHGAKIRIDKQLIAPGFRLHAVLQADVVVAENLNDDRLDLVDGEEASGTGLVAVAKVQGFLGVKLVSGSPSHVFAHTSLVRTAWCFASRPGISRSLANRNPSKTSGPGFPVSALYSGLKNSVEVELLTVVNCMHKYSTMDRSRLTRPPTAARRPKCPLAR